MSNTLPNDSHDFTEKHFESSSKLHELWHTILY